MLPVGTQADPESAHVPRRLIWFVSFAVWMLISFASAFSMYQIHQALGRPTPFRDELIPRVINNLIYAFLTPLVFAGVLRSPIWENNWARRLLAYLGAAFAFTAAHVALRGLLYPVWDPRFKDFVYPFFDPSTHAFSIQWSLFKQLFLYNVVDDVFSVFLLIVLIGHIVSYYQRLRERELRTSQLETELAKAQLEALKAQLHPHFLFNTLHSISSLMLTDVKAADKMMTGLSDLLRMSLEHHGVQITSLRRELDFVKAYLEIEKIRFQDRLRIILEIAPEALDAQVPHLLLQPLVENAVRHGISKMIEQGEIYISAAQNGQRIHLRVRNDCPGARLTESAKLKAGVGLQTTRGRLLRLYGNAQSLEIYNGGSGSFDVHIRIPWQIEHPLKPKPNQLALAGGEG